jgi:hypothetical protein
VTHLSLTEVTHRDSIAALAGAGYWRGLLQDRLGFGRGCIDRDDVAGPATEGQKMIRSCGQGPSQLEGPRAPRQTEFRIRPGPGNRQHCGRAVTGPQKVGIIPSPTRRAGPGNLQHRDRAVTVAGPGPSRVRSSRPTRMTNSGPRLDQHCLQNTRDDSSSRV